MAGQLLNDLLGRVHLDDSAKGGGDGRLDMINPGHDILNVYGEEPLVVGNWYKLGGLFELFGYDETTLRGFSKILALGQVLNAILEPFLTVLFLHFLLQYGRAVAKTTLSQKTIHLDIKGILVCNEDRKLELMTRIQLSNDGRRPTDHLLFTSSALQVFRSQIVPLVDIENLTYPGIDAGTGQLFFVAGGMWTMQFNAPQLSGHPQ